jgi:hypothetical protein
MDLRAEMDQFAQLAKHNITVEGQMEPQLAANLVAALNWCAKQPACKGNLGIPRSQMPQLPFGGIPDFLKWLKAKFGVDSRAVTAEVGKLRATQREINADKVQDIASGNDPIGNDPIPISKGGYVLDGHHRWAALLSRNPRNRIRAVQINMPIKPLLKAANQYPGTFQLGFEESAPMPAGLTLAYDYDRRGR